MHSFWNKELSSTTRYFAAKLENSHTQFWSLLCFAHLKGFDFFSFKISFLFFNFFFVVSGYWRLPRFLSHSISNSSIVKGPTRGYYPPNCHWQFHQHIYCSCWKCRPDLNSQEQLSLSIIMASQVARSSYGNISLITRLGIIGHVFLNQEIYRWYVLRSLLCEIPEWTVPVYWIQHINWGWCFIGSIKFSEKSRSD